MAWLITMLATSGAATIWSSIDLLIASTTAQTIAHTTADILLTSERMTDYNTL